MNTKIVLFDDRKIISENDTDSRYETVFEKKLNSYEIEELEGHIKSVGLGLYSNEFHHSQFTFLSSFVGINEKKDYKENDVEYIILVMPKIISRSGELNG